MGAQGALMGLGFGMQAYGQMQAAKQQARALKREAATARENAQKALDEAEFNADLVEIQGMQIIEGSKAQFVASGFEQGGSVDAVIMNSMVNAELDRLSVIYQGDVRNRDFLNQAKSAELTARDVQEGGLFKTLGTLFQGAGRVV